MSATRTLHVTIDIARQDYIAVEVPETADETEADELFAAAVEDWCRDHDFHPDDVDADWAGTPHFAPPKAEPVPDGLWMTHADRCWATDGYIVVRDDVPDLPRGAHWRTTAVGDIAGVIRPRAETTEEQPAGFRLAAPVDRGLNGHGDRVQALLALGDLRFREPFYALVFREGEDLPIAVIAMMRAK